MRNDGLTPDEGVVMDALATAWNGYTKLEQQHPQDEDEFLSAIHRAQDLLAVRVARREYPEGWTTWRRDEDTVAA